MEEFSDAQMTIAVDPAKSVFQIAASHHPGRADENCRVPRARSTGALAFCRLI